ncbi:TPA: hypothetical protein QDZ99_003596 [Stenotrophomonas maltophilia]|uniref:hypothetical protein n=1 Tax=Stenotrophomonas maltophilia TaxID=40324 RepID=UPI00130F8997|nr:hypothetical protein [Stenotrophomonas maltophilia]MDH2061693.1 hypothetical protein [Stenotrophomonas maltophilia]HDS1129575.1 hypothetical protein [Stenotrophomonas maltophilia]HDS1158303.1 hypothetical protein [Stenotrophomonas maltophilia]HDS1167161.1 hypothetical protein [Stenotrophomonas maltophilia]HDS1171853.1 hypothetical protein [Stenotrophomonas maltophilia]
MRQIARPLPDSVPLCWPGHRPQIVVTEGAPTGHRLGTPCPPLLHIECHRCGLATRPVPMEKAALAELRWTDPSLAHLRIPISLLARHRGEVLAEIAAASSSTPIAA